MGEFRKSSKTACLILGVSCLVAAGCLAFPSFAWFAKAKTTAEADSISGSSTSAYFKGKGTEENPYLIESARQLYYFNWLQDLGYFNEDKGGSVDQIYFSLKNDLDMNGYVLPPAGTTTNPFVGNFKGNGHVIKNLHISNSISELTEKPSNAKDANNDGLLDDAEIVGFFGIVGKWSGKENIDTSINSVSGLYFDKLKITSQAKSTLAGLLAGYVNGSMSDCAVRSGNIAYASDAKPLQNSVFGTDNDKLSKYSLIGDYNSENFEWNGKPSDGGDKWGASVDIFNLSKRISLMTKSLTKDKTYHFKSDNYNLNMSVSNYTSENYDYAGTSANSAMLESGTYLPLSIDEEKMGDLDSFYDNSKSEIVASHNAAYAVGGGPKSGSTNAVVRVRNQKANKDSSQGPSKSFSTFKNTRGLGSTGGTFSEDNFSFLYYDTVNKAQYRLRDDYNKSTAFSDTSATDKDVKDFNFHNYANVKANTLSMFNSSTSDDLISTSSVLLPGMLLLNRNPLSSYADTTTGKNVTIGGKTYGSYQFYSGGINFTLEKDGYMSIAVGVYNTKNDGYFFDIYSVNRSESGSGSTLTSTITGYNKISSISGTPGKGNLAYSFGTTSESGYDASNITFSFEEISNKAILKNSTMYFLEIPMKKGTYFICNAENGKTNCPYILYFDIGTNAESGDDDDGGTPDIDFTYYSSGTELVKLSDASYQKSDVVFSISGTPSPTTFYFWRKDATSGVSYFVEPSGCAITPIGNGTNSNPGSKDDYETSGA